MPKDNRCFVPECRNEPDNIVGHLDLVVGRDVIRFITFSVAAHIRRNSVEACAGHRGNLVTP